VLSRAVASKAEMYGFPLIVWSAGALQSHRFGIPGVLEVLGFASGALVAMTIVVALACGGFKGLLPERDSSIRAFGAVHVVSVLGSVIIGWAVALVARGPLAFFLASCATVLVFEILVSLELHAAAVRNSNRSGEDL
jgi:hypothetical protein